MFDQSRLGGCGAPEPLSLSSFFSLSFSFDAAEPAADGADAKGGRATPAGPREPFLPLAAAFNSVARPGRALAAPEALSSCFSIAGPAALAGAELASPRETVSDGPATAAVGDAATDDALTAECAFENARAIAIDGKAEANTRGGSERGLAEALAIPATTVGRTYELGASVAEAASPGEAGAREDRGAGLKRGRRKRGAGEAPAIPAKGLAEAALLVSTVSICR